MCFIKSSTPKVSVVPEIKDSIKQQAADADLTKNSQNNSQKQGFKQNIKTSAIGLEDIANTQKKTLLGE